MNTPVISIVVPVYKVEAYLRRCLDSILLQTYTDWECILVDDGSPDGCGAICDEYPAKDSRFKVIHQMNQGVTRARANGVSLAAGEWITFVDSDDTLPEKALDFLYLYVSENTDVVVGNCKQLMHERSCDIVDYRKRLLTHRGISVAPWGKLFRKSLFNQFVLNIPRRIVVGEDVIMNVRLAFNSERDVKFCPECVYVYYQNSSSIMHVFRSDCSYELLYYTEMKKSIPGHLLSMYSREVLHGSVSAYILNTAKKINLSSDDLKLRSILYADIKRSGFRLPVFRWLKFYLTTPILRCILIMMTKGRAACRHFL